MGDAAHIHSPALAQGMNTGIHDAWNLAWKLALVQRGPRRPRFLDSYEAERLPVERRVLAMTDFTQNVVADREPLSARCCATCCSPSPRTSPSCGEKAGETVSELAVGYRGSPIVEDHPVPGAPHAGDRAPDASMVGRAGEVRLMSLFGSTHVLLAVSGPRGRGAAAAVCREVQGRFPGCVKAYVVTAAGGAAGRPDDADTLVPKDEGFRKFYGEAESYLLVRPDGYLAFRCDAAHPQRLTDYLSRIFGRPA